MKIKRTQPILCLRPTQFSVGVLEIEHKVVKARRLSSKKLAKLVRKTPIPVVVAPWGDLFVIDAGRLPPSAPSTVVDCTGDEPVVVRVGATPVERLRCVLPSIGRVDGNR